MASRESISKIIVILSAAYPRFQVTADTSRVYAELLADLPDALLMAAAKHHAATSTFFPSVAELRKAASEIQSKAKGLPSAEEAWGEVMHQIRNVGYYGKPQFSTELISRAVEGVGGWGNLCISENMPADRAHFLRIYQNYLERDVADAMLLPAVRAEIGRLADTLKRPALEAHRETREMS